MGRRSHTQSLYLWMNGNFVGTWSMKARVGETLQYDNSWITSEYGRPLSLSLPFTPGNQPHQGEVVRAYFENLLPDSKDILERVARRFKTGSTQAFTLLAEIGRDCVGALQILPDSTPPVDLQTLQALPLDEAEVAQVLRNTLAPTMLVGQDNHEIDFRISIAGAQEKTALLWFNQQWCLPQGSTPSTHIFKLPLGLVGNLKFDMRDSIENEWLCSQILRAYGLPVAGTQILQFEEMKVLAVERFDRRWVENDDDGKWLLRLPQEDMCQATGTPPYLKYESDGGPGIDTIMTLLATSKDPKRDQRIFFQAQVLFWMLAATDGHAKNFSIFLHPSGAYELTPLYDVLSAYPIIGTGANQLSPYKAKMAMAIRSKNPHWVIRDIMRRHWLAVGERHGVIAPDGGGVDAVLDDLVSQTPTVVDTVRDLLPENFPMHVAESIFTGLQTAASKLSR